MLVSFVIVNYNGARWLERCLASLFAQRDASFEVILVDNASTDGSGGWAAEHFPRVRLVSSETNVGFAAGTNLGIRAAQGEAIATLNTDTYVESDYLAQLSAPLSDARVGACAPLMLNMEQPERVDAAGIVVDRFGFAWNRGAGELAEQYRTGGAVYGACAGAALYRRAMLEQVGGFDDDYFGFYEDADLAWRARRFGWHTVFVPTARVYHAHGASFGKISPRKTYLLARNRWWTTLKNYPMPDLLWHMPVMFGLDALALAQAGGRGHLRAAWQGRTDAWHSRKRVWQKRRTS